VNFLSLFLGLWTALDDVFPDGMLLSSMLEAYVTTCSPTSTTSPLQLQPPLLATSSSKGSTSKGVKMESATRPPLATEAQQVHLTLTAVLDRGVREAEKRLDVISFLHR
jgi:hypothetical protein